MSASGVQAADYRDRIVKSRDGTAIAYRVSGTGLSVLLVHGAGPNAGFAWDLVRPHLERHMTVCTMDRRGHGASEPGGAYSFERESDDILAVVAALAEPVHLVGHSLAAVLTLEAALRTDRLASLTLYEPYWGDVARLPPGLENHLFGLIARGDLDGAAIAFFEQVLDVDADAIAVLRSQPAWPQRTAAMVTLPREVRALNTYRFDPARAAGLAVPVLLLTGSASPEWLQAGSRAIEATVRQAHIRELPGQKHVALATAPAMLAAELRQFVEGAVHA